MTDYQDTPQQEAIIGEVMKKFKTGNLKTHAGHIVTDEKQAMAIALSEAGIEADDKHVLYHLKKHAA
ncbi:MAG: DUF6496 domain-containing protein [Candidatus Gastranaerophilales bacterium]|nr:DUF6496 domain-containing protein [Candidatus Gastranaerophilales bacterium]